MATAPVTIPPGLTPHTLGILADSLEQDHRSEEAQALRNLLPFAEALVVRCFIPLFRQPCENGFLSNFNKLSADYGTYRLSLNNQILRLVLSRLTNQSFSDFYEHKLFDILSPLLKTAREMEMAAELISAMIRDYIKITKVFPKEDQPSVTAAPQNSGLTMEQATEVFNFIHAVTRFDYGLTAVLLVLDRSLLVADRMNKWALLSACKGALLDFGEVVSRIFVPEHMPPALLHLESAHINITIAGTGIRATTMATVSHRAHGGQPSRREAEMNWLTTHKDVADQYGGQWIVLEKDQLVANDTEYQKARDTATQRGIKRPFIIFIPRKDTGAFMGI
jgi:hypothetical protein